MLTPTYETRPGVNAASVEAVGIKREPIMHQAVRPHCTKERVEDESARRMHDEGGEQNTEQQDLSLETLASGDQRRMRTLL